MKKISFYILSLFLFFILFELIFTTFFYLKSSYTGPLFRMFVKSDNFQENIILENVKIDKKTDKMVPGSYDINGIKYFINSKGFRGNDFAKENKNNCRIISLGGSITLGVEKTYPNELEKLIIKDNNKCESLNFGMGSKGINYIENLFYNEVVNYSPNIITIMTNRNATMYDSYGNSSKSPGIITSRMSLYIYKLHRFTFSNIMTYRFLDLAVKRVIFLSVKEKNKIINPDDPSILHSINFFSNKYFNQLANIAILSEKNGIKLVLIKEPYYLDIELQKKLKNLDIQDLLQKLIDYNDENYPNKSNLFWIYTNALLNKTFDKIKMNYKNVIVVDPTSLLYSMKKEENFLPDSSNHLNNNGHIIVAEEIYKKIKNKF